MLCHNGSIIVASLEIKPYLSDSSNQIRDLDAPAALAYLHTFDSKIELLNCSQNRIQLGKYTHSVVIFKTPKIFFNPITDTS
jgi:hypothetical protein